MKTGEIDRYLEAGRIAAAARDLGAAMMRPGTTLLEIQLAVEEFIRGEGAGPAFPAQISLNHVAAHDCCPPGDPRELTARDLAKLDVGVELEGYVADTARTVDLAEGAGSPLVAAAHKALEAAIARVRPGVRVGELGNAIQEAIEREGFRPVANLTGHGVGRYLVHCSPQVPNVTQGKGARLAADTALAVEPFACDGKGWVDDLGLPQVFQLAKPPRSRHQLPLALEKAVKARKGLPFARRDLARHLPPEEVEQGLELLAAKGLLISYPPLAERPGVRVSQAEHTLLILADRIQVTTDPDRPPIPL